MDLDLQDIRFITFEGIDGCGKTTQLDLLASWLIDKHVDVFKTAQPGGTELGTKIRRILLKHHGDISPTAELLLFAADRAQHIDTVIRYAVKRGTLVLCDRYIHSTIAYQGYGRGLNLNLIEQLNFFATGGLEPDLTFWIDTPVEVAMSRCRYPDQIERLGTDFQEKVRTGFSDLWVQHFDRIVRIDGNQSAEEIHEEIRSGFAMAANQDSNS